MRKNIYDISRLPALQAMVMLHERYDIKTLYKYIFQRY